LFAVANPTFTGNITLTGNTTLGAFFDAGQGGGAFGGGGGGGAGILTVGGAISGSADVTISQIVVFTGASPNTYTGNTTLLRGSLLRLNKSANVNAIPGGSITGGSVEVQSPNQIPDTVPIASSLSALANETIGPLPLNNGATASSTGAA